LKSALKAMQIYLVGGAVRDALLGLGGQDRDWVVVGATPQALIDQGFAAVGRDFPVFLHPVSHEEYALARTERKTAPGYRGFEVHASPDVTLQDDLARRDLTINAMAVPAIHVHGQGFDPKTVVDPFGGQEDLQRGVLRHVTTAFREDPVRILRLARFCARFAHFAIAPETLQLMQDMVHAGEVDHLVPERVWQEWARGLMEAHPSRMLNALEQCGALQRLLPHLAFNELNLQALDQAAAQDAALAVRFASLLGQMDPERWSTLRAPTDCVVLAQLLVREREALDGALQMDAPASAHLLERCDAWRKPARFALLLQAYALAAPATRPAARVCLRLHKALEAGQAVATKNIAAHAMLAGAKGINVGEAIYAARVSAIGSALESDTVV
jgi:tRNA nucleotidyltransferase (CCA-adding enzyme)